jgi:hypothetical protein
MNGCDGGANHKGGSGSWGGGEPGMWGIWRGWLATVLREQGRKGSSKMGKVLGALQGLVTMRGRKPVQALQ